MDERDAIEETEIILDYLVVGHGLAGCLLADALGNQGVLVAVAGAKLPHAASSVSAGILNPVIGPKLQPPWQASICLDAAQRTYRRLERKHESTFYDEMRIIRIFHSRDMAELWDEKRKRETDAEAETKEAFENGFFGPTLSPERLEREFSAEGRHGAGEILGGGSLDVRGLLAASQKHLKENKRFFRRPLRHGDLRRNGEYLQWDNLNVRKVIFCEGYRLKYNPWFSALPFAPTRGETLKLGPLPALACLNAGSWITPQADGSSLAGSTYEHDDLEAGPTPEGEAEIRRRLSFLRELPEASERLAGVRPSTTDRMPLIGSHPSEPGLVLFNGFGSRATLLAPFCADLLANHLVLGSPIPKEIDLNRFPAAANLPGLE